MECLEAARILNLLAKLFAILQKTGRESPFGKPSRPEGVLSDVMLMRISLSILLIPFATLLPNAMAQNAVAPTTAADKPAATGEPASEIPTFRSDVSLVKVDVRVVPGPNKPSSVLEKEDFTVIEDGKPQTVRYFNRESEPLNLMLVLDVSDSMRPSLRALSSSVRQALGTWLEPKDKVGVALFATRSFLAQPLTSERGAISEAIISNIFKQQLGRDTYLNEGLQTAIQELQRTPPAERRAILIVTDNVAGPGSTPMAQVERALQESNILVNSIMIPIAEDASVRPSVDVAQYVRATGGETMTASNAGEVFAKLVERIKARYVLEYPMQPGEKGKFRTVRVELSDRGKAKYPGAKILARDGYFVP
jgi:Ca-activated chloride channel homolog